MMPSEILRRSRDASLRLREIGQVMERMRSSVGPGSRSYETLPIAARLDPSRHVDEILDWESERAAEIAALSADVDDARSIIAGVPTVWPDDGEVAADVMSRYYVDGMSADEVAEATGVAGSVVAALVGGAPSALDAVGVARLRACASRF